MTTLSHCHAPLKREELEGMGMVVLVCCRLQNLPRRSLPSPALVSAVPVAVRGVILGRQ